MTRRSTVEATGHTAREGREAHRERAPARTLRDVLRDVWEQFLEPSWVCPGVITGQSAQRGE